jgi:hypothetical protein
MRGWVLSTMSLTGARNKGKQSVRNKREGFFLL